MQMDPVQQFMHIVTTSDPDSMQLNGPNEAYHAYLFDACKDKIHEMRFSVPVGGSPISSDAADSLKHDFFMSRLFDVEMVPVEMSMHPSLGIDKFSMGGLLSALKFAGMALAAVFALWLIMVYYAKERRLGQRFRMYFNADGNYGSRVGSVLTDERQHVHRTTLLHRKHMTP